MKLTIDTRHKRFVVTRPPEPKLDQHKEQRIDKSSGEPMWLTQVVCVDEQGGDIIGVTTTGEKPDAQLDDEVSFFGLEAIPWNTTGRNGVAYRADAMRVDE